MTLAEENPPRIVYMGSPALSAEILSYILEHQLAEVVAVWTAPLRPRGMRRNRSRTQPSLSTTPVGEVAKKWKLPLHESERIGDEDILQLQTYAFEFSLIVAYGQILPEAFFQSSSHRAYNVHFSLLPRHRGASPITAAILSGDKETGITIQRIVAKLDAGPILLKRAFPAQGLRYEQVLSMSLDETRIGLRDFFKQWKTLPAEEQNHAEATYSGKIKPHETMLQAEDDAGSFYRKVLAFGEWKGVSVFIAEERYFIETAACLSVTEMKELFAERQELFLGEAGNIQATITSRSLLHGPKKRLILYFPHTNAPSALEIFTLKRAGRRVSTSVDFINSHKQQFPIVIDHSSL